VAVVLALATSLTVGANPVLPAYQPGIPPVVDPGTPTYLGPADPVPPEPVGFDPTRSMLEAIYEADLAAGGESFWVDRILERPAGGNGGNALYTRGRALFMASHAAGTLGFAGAGTTANQGGGGFGYREPAGTGVRNLYTVGISGANLAEDTAARRQYPSHWSSVHTATGLSVLQRKFITHNNVAVTLLTLTNTGAAPTAATVSATSPVTTATSADGTERTGTFATRYNVTTVNARFSGEGFAVVGNNLERAVTLDPGQSATLKLQLGTTAAELPESNTEYERYRGLDATTAFRTHLAEYNRWWVDNVPYIDVPDENVDKMSWYRTFLNRFNYFDANIPGNDFQFPVSVEGALGYNNAIQLTQSMHLQDLKYFRDPLYSYGDWVTSGETSRCDAFTDNPGSHSWGNTYEQYIAREAWNAYKVHGGNREIIENFAHYAECDVEGQLNKYDSNGNRLIEYNVGFLTGNDADTPTFHWAQYRGQPTRQDRAESAFQYAGATAAAEAYALLGDDAKAAEMEALAEEIRQAVLTILWDDAPAGEPPTLEPVPATRAAGQAGFGNAVRLGNPEPNRFVDMPDGILSGLNDFTIATWVNLNSSTVNWTRIFDFGTGTQVNMFLTPRAGVGGNPVRFAITTNGGGAEQQVNRAGSLPTGWQHVAVTRAGTTGTIYINGAPVATSPNITLSPSSMGNTTNNWIGRSQYNDPMLAGLVDEFQIYDRPLTPEEVQSLLMSPGGTPGGGNVAWYRFDEADGATATDSSGNERHATVETVPQIVGEWPGKVFKHQLTSNGERVEWKDQQNFTPFMEGLVPNTPEYVQALRYYADAAEFPIMPSYTSNQADKAFAAAVGIPGSNNFSNINFTLQAQIFARALREYPSEHITQEMYRKLLEWSTWTQYVDGDNRLPNNNEFFFSWNPATKTFGRSGIFHNILGAYNFMIIDDIAGVRPRLDDDLELWPIDVGWDHFAINNLRYHGRDLTLVWDRPGDGTVHYPGVPEGYSAFLDGQRVLTVGDLAHVSYDSSTGAVSVLDGSNTGVAFSAAVPLRAAADISLTDNARVADMFQKAGTDLSAATGWRDNLARGRPVTASFTTTAPALRATTPEFAVDGFTISGLPANGPAGQARAGYVAPNTIWGTQGSPNAQDWFEVDLQAARLIDTVRLYFFSDKSYNPQQNVSRDTYRQPSAYSIQVHDGTDWIDVPGQERLPATPQPNYNEVTFPQVVTQRVRVLMTPIAPFGIGLKEIQVFDTSLYLHDDPAPPAGDATSQPRLPLDNTAPTATNLFNYDTDRDAFAGLMIHKGGAGAGETDPTKAQAWRYTAPQAGLALTGDVELTVFSGMKDFESSTSARNKRGFVRAFLRDCPASGACTLITSTSLDRRRWHGGTNAWMEDTLTFAGVDHTVAPGRFLEVKLTVDGRADDDMWFAYDTTTQPARLTVP
jgi:Concanavalin A-like lectin/glucanases superfamily/F5/8 type C domain